MNRRHWIAALVAMACLLLHDTGAQDAQPAPGEKGLTQTNVKKAAPKSSGKRWALLIGVNDYEHMPHLEYCAQDMEMLCEVLINHGGYEPKNVQLLCDAPTPDASDDGKNVPERIRRSPTGGSINMAIYELLDQVGEDDSVLIAFSGHGQDSQKDGDSYLIPIDVSPLPGLLEKGGFSLTELNEKLADCRAKQKILILDACHSGGKAGDAPLTSFNPPDGKGTIQLLSCQRGELSVEDPDLGRGAGVFSYFLAEAIKGAADEAGNKDGYVSVDEAFDYAQLRTKEFVAKKYRRQQRPRFKGERSGQIVLGSRRGGERPVGLSRQEIEAWLARAAQKQDIPPGFDQKAKAWLDLGDVGAARSLQLSLSLLAREAITFQQFKDLADTRVQQAESHLAAMRSARSGKVKALVMGIDRYGASQDLQFAVADAKLFFETLTRHVGRNAAPDDLVLLLNEQVTAEALKSQLARLLDGTGDSDLIVVYFSGLGWFVEDRPLKSRETGWMLHGAERAALAGDHRGLSFPAGFSDTGNINRIWEKLKGSAADVLVVSDTCYATISEPAFATGDVAVKPQNKTSSDNPDDPKAAKTKDPATRLFLGCTGEVYEVTGLQHGVLTLEVCKAIAGAADRSAPRAFLPELSAIEGPPAHSDGYITLRELAHYMSGRRVLRLNDRQVQEIEILGKLGTRDVVVTTTPNWGD